MLPLPDGRYLPFVQENLGDDDRWLQGAPQYLVWSAVRQGAVQRRGELEVPLADGRTARSLVVAPIPWDGGLVGVLLALRVAEDYDLERGSPIGELASLAGVELAAAERRRRRSVPGAPAAEASLTEARMREAIALHELGRLAMRGGGVGGAATLIGEILGYGVVGIWGREGDAFVLRSGHGFAPSARPQRIDAAEAPAVRAGEARRFDAPAGAWAAGATTAIGAGIADQGAGGILALASPKRVLTADDVTIAAAVASAVALLEAGSRAAHAALRVPAAPLPSVASAAPPASAVPATRAPETSRDGAPGTPAGGTARPAWRRALPLLIVAAMFAAAGAVLVEPVAFAAAGLLVLGALWVAGR